LWNESFFSAPQLKRDPLGGPETVVSRVRETISFLEIVAGTWGTVIGLIFVTHVSGIAILFGLFVIAVFSFFGVAGILLYRQHALGYPFSVVTQLLQIPVFLTPWGGYYCIGGAGLRVWVDAEGSFGWYVHLGSQLHISWAAEPYVSSIGLNLVPVVLLVLLVASRRATKLPDAPASVERAA